ncbi:MAG: hypothetical protein ACI9HI_000164, partial [Salinirussus sp.]
ANRYRNRKTATGRGGIQTRIKATSGP